MTADPENCENLSNFWTENFPSTLPLTLAVSKSKHHSEQANSGGDFKYVAVSDAYIQVT